MNNNAEIQNDDEISLLDLFIVLLRYWKLIAGVTLAFIIPVTAGFFIYPAYKYKKAMEEVKMQGIMQLEIVPKAQTYISQSLDSFILRSDIIYESLYSAGMKEFTYKGGKESISGETQKRVMSLIDMFWIKNIVLKGNTSIREKQDNIFNLKRMDPSSVMDTSSVYEITFKNKDSELIKKFMESLYKLCTVSVADNLQIAAQAMVSNYEHFMNLSNTSEATIKILEKNFDAYIYLKSFLEGKESAVKMVSGPVIVENYVSLSVYKRQFLKTGIIIVFAGFILAVILAYVLNAIRIIKNDEEAMKKIRDALGNSGRK